MKNLRKYAVPGHAPEDTLFDTEGHVVTGLKDTGTIVRVDLTTGEVSEIARTGGKPLGLEWMPDGQLLVCNADLGLQIVDISSGVVTELAVHGTQIHLANNAHVLPDGAILVSDSSAKFPVDDFAKDLVQNTATGRLLKVTPDGAATVLLDGLCFANGVVWLAEENAVLVAATGTRTITKIDLASGVSTPFATVDGHPDNLSLGSDGRIWVAVPSYTNPTLAQVHRLPTALRKLVSALPASLQPQAQKCCRVQVFNLDGSVHATHDGDTDVYHMVTGVREQDGRVAMGSIEQNAIALFDL